MPDRCPNHPKSDAETKCHLCGKEFCPDCITLMKSRSLCHKCLDIEIAFEENRLKGNTTSAKTIGWGCALVMFLFFVFVALALLLPYFKGSKANTCRNNLKAIYKQLIQYSEDFGGKLPPVNNDLTPLVTWGGPRIELEKFVCPSTGNAVRHSTNLKDNSAAVDGDGMSYFYQGGLSISTERRRKQPRVPLVWDQSPENHQNNTIYVLYLDGEIKKLKNNFPKLK
jgi:hypothetical protein